MRRRAFIAALGGVAMLPRAARAQQAMPVVGFLRSASAAEAMHLVTAFRDERLGRLSLVVINNSTGSKTFHIEFGSDTLKGRWMGEQSTSEVRWKTLPALIPAAKNAIDVTIPSMSVTSLAGGYR